MYMCHVASKGLFESYNHASYNPNIPGGIKQDLCLLASYNQININHMDIKQHICKRLNQKKFN